MKYLFTCRFVLTILSLATLQLQAAPLIDPIPSASIPAGKSLTIPITATSPNGRPLTYTVTSSTNRITVEIHTNNPFWKISVAQIAPSNAPGAYVTPFRGTTATVTNLGDMTLLLFRDRAPHTVDVFQGLTMAGFFSTNTIFHRVVPGFVIQGGDPDTNGFGGPVFRFDDEFHQHEIFSGNGQLAMANTGKDTDGSQFFITFGPQRSLDFGYTIFGQLLRGFNVASNIVNTPSTNDRPYTDVIMTRASIVSNSTDTAITLTGTNRVGVSGTIKVIADDGTVGGRVTNTFTATMVSDATNNAPPFLARPAITNLYLAVNHLLTNYIAAVDLEKNTNYFDTYFTDGSSSANAFYFIYPGTNGKFVLVPKTDYSGPLHIYVAVGPNADLSPYDYQKYTIAVGDTPISASASNFLAQTGVPFINQLVATFTNGVASSSPTNFTASINWGDNSITDGVVQTNSAGRKEVRGAHTYLNSGQYPFYVTINSSLGAQAVVNATATVPPALALTRNGTNNLLHWPSWAFDYAVQTRTNLTTTNWTTLSNAPVLIGHENFITNGSTTSNLFFRLRR